MSVTNKPIIAMSAPVSIAAAEVEGDKKLPPKFMSTFYTGGKMDIAGWDLPVVVDLSGLENGKVLVANLDHDKTKRVGNFAVANDGRTLVANGTASAATAYRDEVVNSAADGYQWQASLEVNPREVYAVKPGKSVEVNGQSIEGPAYVARRGVLKGFAFVSHGADDNTTATIAAAAALNKEQKMKKELKAWIEGLGFDPDTLSAEQVANMEADFDGREGLRTAPKVKASNPFEARKLEAQRRVEIRDLADALIERRNSDVEEINAIEEMHDHALEAGMSPLQFRVDLQEAVGVPSSQPVRPNERDRQKIDGRLLEAAICQAARLDDIEKHYDDRTLQAAHDRFRGRIGLKQIFLLAAESNGHRNPYSGDVDRETLKAAFENRPIHGAGFSTLDISTIVSNTANKFIMRGWNMIDQAALRIAKIQNVRDFKTITTVSLTDSLIYEKVGAGGEIKHGTLSELTYTNKADTYAKMLAITRNDIINDDLGALTDVPMKLGAGAMKKLNDIFWTEYLGLVGASFFASGNSNINEGVATMTEAGLDATYVIFKNQTNPDGTPLGVEPRIIVVPSALEGSALRLMRSENFNNGATTNQGERNIWANRFDVVSSPYISNSSYTGNTAVGWWLLADPMELPVIAIAALNGRVEPTVDTAEADFNVLGVQMRGYSDVGVNDQEYRGGVYADGGAS